MMLPEAERAIVAPEKILRYLLDPTNLRNQGKHVVFFALGYTHEAWERLRDDLLTLGRTHPVIAVDRRGEDVVYTVDGPLPGPNGRVGRMRTIWQVDAGTDFPRLVSAYPAPGRRRL